MATFVACLDTDGWPRHTPPYAETGLEAKSIAGEKGRRSYAIQLDKNGDAVINRDWVVTQYHRTFLKLPSGTMREGDGFEWKKLRTVRPTVKSARKGRVTFTAIVEGTVYHYAIRKTEDSKSDGVQN